MSEPRTSNDPRYPEKDCAGTAEELFGMSEEEVEAIAAEMDEPQTWLLRDIGYDGNKPGELWKVTDKSFIDAVRQLDGLESASHMERNGNAGSTFHVYAKAHPATRADWTKIGMVRDETPL